MIDRLRAIAAARTARFWSKVNVAEPDDCWEWTASKSMRGGYGRFWVEGRRPVQAHRFAYEEMVGPIPAGLVLDHLCRNHACVNPAHVEPVTNRENILRGAGVTARQVEVTHCRKGHPYSPENTWLKKGHRVCRACDNQRSRDWKARKRAALDARIAEVTK